MSDACAARGEQTRGEQTRGEQERVRPASSYSGLAGASARVVPPATPTDMDGAWHGAAHTASRATHLSMIAALAVVAAHIVVVWGYPSLFWGDNGRWLYEVDRVAHGARFYRDVYWAFPPLGMWLVGGAARVIGSDLAQIWGITAVIALAIAAAYGAVVARLVPPRLAVPVAATGMLLGAAYSQQLSAPLALGMYSPAVPVAMLLLLLQLLAFLRDWRAPSTAGALAVGALGGLGFLAKHDVWFIGAWLAFAAGVFTPLAAGDARRMVRVVAAGASYALVAAAGIGALIAMHGVDALRDIFTGFGHVDEFSGINLPDLAQLTVEVATFGFTVVAVAAIARGSGIWSGRGAVATMAGGASLAAIAIAFWLFKADELGRAVLANGPTPAGSATLFEQALLPVPPEPLVRLRKAFGVLRVQMLRHAVPLLVTIAALALVAWRRRRVRDASRWRLVAILVVACLALRSRRMISYTEWSALMIELPVYIAALATLWEVSAERLARAGAMACLVLVAVGFSMHWRFGYGAGSRRGIYPSVATVRGPVRLAPGLARDLDYVRDLSRAANPSGERPIFAFGYSAGFSYLLGRPSVGSMTQGMRLSLYPSADSAYRVAAAQKRRLILVDNPSYVDGMPSAEFAPWRWKPVMVPNPYARVDRPLFDRLKADCQRETLPGRSSWLTVYDCAHPANGGAAE